MGQTHDFATIKSEKNLNKKYFYSDFFSIALENIGLGEHAHKIL